MTDLERIELEIKAEENKIELSEAWVMLKKNKYFKQLFTEAYLKDYALGLLTFKASIQAQEPKVQSHVDMQLNGVGALQQFLSNVSQTGRVAIETLASHKKERELIMEDKE